MSLITWRDRNTDGRPTGPTWFLEFDALTVEEFARTAEVTQYPIETGAVLSDHYQPMPREISLTGVVSDTPTGTSGGTKGEKVAFDTGEGRRARAKPPTMITQPLPVRVPFDKRRLGPAGIPRPLSTTILPGRRIVQANVERARLHLPRRPAQTLQVVEGQAVDRVARFLSELDALMGGRVPCAVILHTGVEYTDMMITDLRAPRTARASGQITFSIDMQEVVKAEPVETKAAQERPAPEHKSKKAKGSGGRGRPGSKDLPKLADLADKGFRIP